jgi:lysine 2,3-aminomutase
LVHRYPDRVLFLVTDFCSTNCRYCTRSRLIGKSHRIGSPHLRWAQAVKYIEKHREIRDVLISGGDPLTLEDTHLEWLLESLREIPHVEIIRIGTKVPAVMPMRITKELTDTLRKYHPLFMSLHFIHPREITPETSEACARLAYAGIPLGSQTVLLKGINDDAEVLTRLFQGLLRIRVKPYYLYQCDPVAGTSHFRTPVEKGIELLEKVRGFTSGYAVPAYVVDAPGGGGKIQLLADHIEGRQGGELLLRNYEGKEFRYPDPGGSVTSCRLTSEKS